MFRKSITVHSLDKVKLFQEGMKEEERVGQEGQKLQVQNIKDFVECT